MRPLFCKIKNVDNGPEEDSGYLLSGISFGDMGSYIGDSSVFSRLLNVQNKWISNVVQQRTFETDRTLDSSGSTKIICLTAIHFLVLLSSVTFSFE